MDQNKLTKILLAQKKHPLGVFEGLGPLGKRGLALNIRQAVDLFNKVVSNTIGFITIVAGIWFIFQFITGAFGWLTAGGDKAKVEMSQKRITNSIIGLGIVVAAVFLIDFIGSLLGLKILSPGDFIFSLWD